MGWVGVGGVLFPACPATVRDVPCQPIMLGRYKARPTAETVLIMLIEMIEKVTKNIRVPGCAKQINVLFNNVICHLVLIDL